MWTQETWRSEEKYLYLGAHPTSVVSLEFRKHRGSYSSMQTPARAVLKLQDYLEIYQ